MRPITLSNRRFLPLFATQSLNAFNDNLFKNALVVFVVFRAPAGGAALVALSGGIFLLPYLFLSAIAGQLADRFSKSRLIVLTQWGAVGMMAAAAVALSAGSIPALLAVLFGLGVHAALFGPLKYGILPELMPDASLLRANALVEAGTFAAILVGTVAGGVLIGMPGGALAVGAVGVSVALAGLVAAWALPPLPPADPALRLRLNFGAETLSLLRATRSNRPVWVSALGLSWFWAVGATFLAQFPVLAQTEFGGDNRVVTLLLTAFALGVGLGSLHAGRRSPGPAPAPGAALWLSGFTWGFAALAGSPAAARWNGPGAMLTSPAGLAAFACLLGAAWCGGLYSVPLYALLQQAADRTARARAIAANNVVNAVFIVLSAIAVAGLVAVDVRPPIILTLTGAANVAAAWWLRSSLQHLRHGRS